jgi:hypothetical protein
MDDKDRCYYTGYADINTENKLIQNIIRNPYDDEP